MAGRVIVAGAVVAALAVAGPAVADPSQPQSKSVTATGIGQARVHAKNRHSNASIVTAVDAARKRAVTSAIDEAHEYALGYAKVAGMTLGGVVSISDQTNSLFGFYGPGSGSFTGPFGPNRYCGTTEQLARRPAPGVPPVFKKVHHCIVPRFSYVTLTVTYAAS